MANNLPQQLGQDSDRCQQIKSLYGIPTATPPPRTPPPPPDTNRCMGPYPTDQRSPAMVPCENALAASPTVERADNANPNQPKANTHTHIHTHTQSQKRHKKYRGADFSLSVPKQNWLHHPNNQLCHDETATLRPKHNGRNVLHLFGAVPRRDVSPAKAAPLLAPCVPPLLPTAEAHARPQAHDVPAMPRTSVELP